MSGPCLCGAPDCRRCFPGTWWHEEYCDDSGECDCHTEDDEPDYDGDEE